MSAKRTQRKRPKRRRPKKTKRRRRSRRGGGPKPVGNPKPGLFPVLAAAATIAGTAAAATAYMGHHPQQVPVVTDVDDDDDDVAIVLITTHGGIMPTTTSVGDVEYLEGRPLLEGLDGITIYKMNAVSPGICNYLSDDKAVSHAQLLASIFGYHCDPTPDDPFAINEGTYQGMDFPSMYGAAVNFEVNARTLMYMYKEMGHERGEHTPLVGDPGADDRDGYDKEQHSYKLYKMTRKTRIFNKVFDMSEDESVVRTPYDWDITMFDRRGPSSLIGGLLDTGHARVVKDATLEKGVPISRFITSTVDILSYLHHSRRKRRIIIVDMTCDVSPFPDGPSEITRHDTAGRGAIRDMKGIPHGG